MAEDLDPFNFLLPYGNQIAGGLVKPTDQFDKFDASNLNNGIFQIREGIAEVFRAQRTNKNGPWYAVVLHVETYIDPGWSENPGPLQYYPVGGSMQESKPREFLQVWARRYPDDQGVMQPDWSFIDVAYVNPNRIMRPNTPAKRMALIKAHDYYIVPLDMWGPRRDPMPGDLVWVTFDDIPNQSRGRLLDFTDPGSNPPTVSNWAGNMSMGAQGQFADPSQPLSDLFEEDRGPTIRPPRDDELEEARQILAQMAPGPDVAVPNDLIFAQAGPPRERVQTVIWESYGYSSPLVYTEAAPYLIAMYLAARREGVNLVLTSGWREPAQDITGALLNQFLFGPNGEDLAEKYVKWDGTPLSDEFMNKTKRDERMFNKSQLTLRLDNCTPDGQELTSNCVCTPLTGMPKTTTDYAYGHLTGYAFDTSSGMAGTGDQPQPGRISPMYRWLCLNAWKYGFLRTVGGDKSERWHWELRLNQTPRPRVFDKIPRNHGSWDGQFNGTQDYFEDTYEAGLVEAAKQKARDDVMNEWHRSDQTGPMP